MTPEDRDLLQLLRRRQIELQESLEQIGDQLAWLEAAARNGGAAEPLPAKETKPVPLPSLPAEATLPPVPPVAARPAAPAALPPVPRTTLEFRMGRWLTRIGVVFGIIALALVLSLTHHFLLTALGPAGIVALSGALCVGVVIVAERLERSGLTVFARSLLALGLAGLYVTLYSAHAVPELRVIESPLLAGVVLLLWSVYAYFVAERKGSQALAFCALALAYFSTAINPIGRFAMAADLLLAGSAVFILLYRGWTSLSYLSLLGTYLAPLRRLILDPEGNLVLDTSRALPFAPYAVYLVGAWIVFTGAVLFSGQASFRGDKRLVFLSLNNGALAGLLALTTYIAGYGTTAMGWTLFWTGLTFLGTALFAGGRRPDGRFGEVTGAYFAQGLAVFTVGMMGIFAGITRGVLLILESFFLGIASTFSRSAVVRIGTAATALLATACLAWEIGVEARHPWLLSVLGATILLANAWWTRCASLRPRREFMPLSTFYCLLALGLVGLALWSELSDSAAPPALALMAVVFTFVAYLVPLFELPYVAQALLLAAQGLVLFPAETGEAMPRASHAWVAFFTLVLLAWWGRQKLVRTGGWTRALQAVYSLVLVALMDQAVRPGLGDAAWMIAASLLSGAFLVVAVFLEIWLLAAAGQLFLVAAACLFFLPNGLLQPFAWPWWVASVPVAVAYLTGRSAHAWLRENPELATLVRRRVGLVAYAYRFLALIMLARLVFGVAPERAYAGIFLALGTLILAWSALSERGGTFGVRCSFLLTTLGLACFGQQLALRHHGGAAFAVGCALFLFLCQPTLLRHAARRLVSRAEHWTLAVLSAVAGWLYVDALASGRGHADNLTLSWALYAFFLFVFGLLVWERRQRWCGLAILAVAMIRVLCWDIWGFSTGYKVLNFFVLSLITLGIGFVYARWGERLRSWL